MAQPSLPPPRAFHQLSEGQVFHDQDDCDLWRAKAAEVGPYRYCLVPIDDQGNIRTDARVVPATPNNMRRLAPYNVKEYE